MALGPAITVGCTFITRSKFSASNFWTDCIKYNATCAQYIGEICRFLIGTPSIPEEKQHKIRAMYGVGLGKEIWTEFVTRFNVSELIRIKLTEKPRYK